MAKDASIEIFARYRLIRMLGKGAVGEVFLAEMTSAVGVAKPCIIKRLRPHLQDNEHVALRFADEMQILSRLQHPNIVNAFEFGEHDSQKYVAMELVDGLSLQDLLDYHLTKGIPLPTHFALYILIHIAKGINFLHDPEINGHAAIIHRDLAPHNILLSKNGEVKIADFGLAKSELNVAHSTDGSVKGHLRYMSPEQAKGKTISAASDIFSLGIIAYEMFSGQQFFDFHKLGISEAILKIRNFSPLELKASVRSLEPELQEVIQTMVAVEPESRISPASHLVNILTEILRPETLDTVEPDYIKWIKSIVPVYGSASDYLPDSGSIHLTRSVTRHASEATDEVEPENNTDFDYEPVVERSDAELTNEVGRSPNRGDGFGQIRATPYEDVNEPLPDAYKPWLEDEDSLKLATNPGDENDVAINIPLPKRSLISRILPSRKWMWRLPVIAIVLFIFTVVGLEEGFIPEQPFTYIQNHLGSLSNPTDTKQTFKPSSKPIPKGGTRLIVRSNPSGARIRIAGHGDAYFTPYEFNTLKAAKKQALVIDKVGFKPYRETFVLKADEERILVVTLTPLP